MKPLLLSLLLLSGCATFEPPPREYRKTMMLVEWVELDSVREECRNDNAVACARLAENTCTIFTGLYPSLDTLGHEVLHCFTGRWH